MPPSPGADCPARLEVIRLGIFLLSIQFTKNTLNVVAIFWYLIWKPLTKLNLILINCVFPMLSPNRLAMWPNGFRDAATQRCLVRYLDWKKYVYGLHSLLLWLKRGKRPTSNLIGDSYRSWWTSATSEVLPNGASLWERCLTLFEQLHVLAQWKHFLRESIPQLT